MLAGRADFEATADPYVPVASVLEGAKLKGMATGLVATSSITHATPAGFAVHLHNRGLDFDIMEQLVYQDIDVVFGGGKNALLSDVRSDGEDLLQVLLDRGYQFVETADEMADVSRGKAWGIASGHMDPDMDRDDLNPTQPSPAQMTEKAIGLLSRNRHGFFLMVEGSQVDRAGHANDAAYMAGDFMAFDEAVKVAVEFAKNDRHTLVLAFPDHNTGALSLGHQQSGFPPSYTKTKIEHLIDPIKDATMTIQALLYEVPSPATAGDVRDTFVAYHGQYWAKMTDAQAEFIAGVLNESGPYGGYYTIA